MASNVPKNESKDLLLVGLFVGTPSLVIGVLVHIFYAQMPLLANFFTYVSLVGCLAGLILLGMGVWNLIGLWRR